MLLEHIWAIELGMFVTHPYPQREQQKRTDYAGDRLPFKPRLSNRAFRI